MITQNKSMDNHGICSARHPPAHRPLANATCLVSGWNPHLTRLSSHIKRVRYGVGIPVCLAKEGFTDREILIADWIGDNLREDEEIGVGI